jgi:leucyl-tRNA synthetase
VPLEPKSFTTLFDSCWYFLRFADPVDTGIFGSRVNEYMPVDYYVGGREHSILHLLYARFITRFLFETGYLDVAEPFSKFLSVGKVTVGGEKMSKSSGNRVEMAEVLSREGSDVSRLYVLAERPFWRELEFSRGEMRKYANFLRRLKRLLLSFGGELRPYFALFPLSSSSLGRQLFEITREVSEGARRCFGTNKFHHIFAVLQRSLKRLEKATVGVKMGVEELAWCKVALTSIVVYLYPFAPRVSVECMRYLGFNSPREAYDYVERTLKRH